MCMEVEFSFTMCSRAADELDARFNPGDRLEDQFRPRAEMETKDWIAVVLASLLCTPQGEVSVAIFRRWVEEANDFDDRDLRPLPAEMINTEYIIVLCHFR